MLLGALGARRPAMPQVAVSVCIAGTALSCLGFVLLGCGQATTGSKHGACSAPACPLEHGYVLGVQASRAAGARTTCARPARRAATGRAWRSCARSGARPRPAHAVHVLGAPGAERCRSRHGQRPSPAGSMHHSAARLSDGHGRPVRRSERRACAPKANCSAASYQGLACALSAGARRRACASRNKSCINLQTELPRARARRAQAREDGPVLPGKRRARRHVARGLGRRAAADARAGRGAGAPPAGLRRCARPAPLPPDRARPGPALPAGALPTLTLTLPPPPLPPYRAQPGRALPAGAPTPPTCCKVLPPRVTGGDLLFLRWDWGQGSSRLAVQFCMPCAAACRARPVLRPSGANRRAPDGRRRARAQVLKRAQKGAARARAGRPPPQPRQAGRARAPPAAAPASRWMVMPPQPRCAAAGRSPVCAAAPRPPRNHVTRRGRGPRAWVPGAREPERPI